MYAYIHLIISNIIHTHMLIYNGNENVKLYIVNLQKYKNIQNQDSRKYDLAINIEY